MMDDLTKATGVLSLTPTKNGISYLLGGETTNPDVTKLTLPKLLPPAIELSVSLSEEFSTAHDQLRLLSFPAQSGPLAQGKLSSLRKLTHGDAKVVYSATIVLDDGQHLQYNAGDSVGLLCANSDSDVEWLLSRIEFGDVEHADKHFCVRGTGIKAKSPPVWLLPGIAVTARFLLTYCCELHIPVTRRITRMLAACCTRVRAGMDSNFPEPRYQSARLLEFSSREGSALFDKYIRDPNVTLMDLLASFPACHIPIAQLLEVLPRLQPRAYTVINPPDPNSSSSQSLQIAFTRVDFVRSTENDPIGLYRYPHRVHGVCTGWLERLWFRGQNEAKFLSLPGLYVRKNLNGFRIPDSGTEPVIMIGAGTGIAPFLNFMEQERRRRLKDCNTKRDFWLIYGCRSPNTSLLFPDQLAQALVEGVLSRLCICFSRYKADPNDPKLPACSDYLETLLKHSCFHSEANYVQHCISSPARSTACFSIDEQDLVQWILDRNAIIMVCGEARAMAPSIREAVGNLLDLARSHEKKPFLAEFEDSDGHSYVKRMRDEKRFLEDIWT